MEEEHAGKEYPVKCAGYDELTWQLEANLNGAQSKIQQFEDETIGDYNIRDDVELSVEENVGNVHHIVAHSDGGRSVEVEILKRKLAESNESLAKTRI